MNGDGSAAGAAPEPLGFAAFCVAVRPRVCAVLRTMTGGDREVEDAVQEALLIARHRWVRVGSYERPDAWVVKVALRMLLRWRRRDRLRFADPADDPPDIGATRAFDDVERDSDLARVIATLPPRQRDVITLHYRLDLSVAQIADVLDLRPGTVTGALARGRAAIADRWADDGRWDS